jgi:AraC family transcriptional regulator, regulatory protein of adaptative response / methylated-DNA-[protein]-cysteine methyltransferase
MELKMPKSSRQDRHLQADAARWVAVCERHDDDTFYYAVVTTGIFCRPVCSSRQPRRENVSFHDSVESAAAAGYRACKRCRPDEPAVHTTQQVLIAGICRHIEASESIPDLDSLGAQAGLSRFHFHRLFKSIVGLTPRAYAVAARAQRMQTALREEERVTDAIYRAGFGSQARFYANSSATLGMTPGECGL